MVFKKFIYRIYYDCHLIKKLKIYLKVEGWNSDGTTLVKAQATHQTSIKHYFEVEFDVNHYLIIIFLIII